MLKMDLIQALLLSIVEGITEFLPISSTGHLLLASNILGIYQSEFVKSFEIIIQLGAISAVIFVYWKNLISSLNLWKKIIVGFIPSAIVGFTFYDFIKEVLFENILVTVAALLIGGLVIIFIERIHIVKEKAVESVEKLSLKQAFLIGIAQSLSVIPGTSRAASTIIGGLLVGANRKTAVEFSFLLAIPTMMAATGLDLIKSGFNFTSEELSLLGIGLIVSFLTALAVVRWFIQFIQTNNFFWFGVYRIVLAVLFLIFLY